MYDSGAPRGHSLTPASSVRSHSPEVSVAAHPGPGSVVHSLGPATGGGKEVCGSWQLVFAWTLYSPPDHIFREKFNRLSLYIIWLPHTKDQLSIHYVQVFRLTESKSSEFQGRPHSSEPQPPLRLLVEPVGGTLHDPHVLPLPHAQLLTPHPQITSSNSQVWKCTVC